MSERGFEQNEELEMKSAWALFYNALAKELAGKEILTRFKGLQETDVRDRTVVFSKNPAEGKGFGQIAYYDQSDKKNASDKFAKGHIVAIGDLVRMPGVYEIAVQVLESLEGVSRQAKNNIKQTFSKAETLH